MGYISFGVNVGVNVDLFYINLSVMTQQTRDVGPVLP